MSLAGCDRIGPYFVSCAYHDQRFMRLRVCRGHAVLSAGVLCSKFEMRLRQRQFMEHLPVTGCGRIDDAVSSFTDKEWRVSQSSSPTWRASVTSAPFACGNHRTATAVAFTASLCVVAGLTFDDYYHASSIYRSPAHRGDLEISMVEQPKCVWK